VTYREAVDWLYGLQLYGIKLGLENMRRLCAALEVYLGPQPIERSGESGEPPKVSGLNRRSVAGEQAPVFIHVAGTNGKGSVCAMLDAICRRGGIRCGLYTSPHLVTFRERIRRDGEMIPEADVAAGLTRIRDLVAAWEHPPTFFEVTTALALDWFQDQHAHVVILETGLGGRLDATNVVTPAVSVLTPIGFDHQQVLGDSLVQIAAEKCGIIKPGVPVVSAPQEADAAAVILATARRLGSACEWITEPWPGNVGLLGEHQRWNAALAVQSLDTAALNYSFLQVGTEAVGKALALATWPGRFQPATDRVILDGAHNPAGAQALVNTWRASFGSDRATIILGMMRDKDFRGVIRTLLPVAARVFTVAVDNPRAMSSEDLAKEIRSLAPELPVRDFSSLAVALHTARREAERILIAGSLFLVGAALVELGLAQAEGERSDQ
jgi:dihydrofolate synthase/folylpolyglutamate synthase